MKKLTILFVALFAVVMVSKAQTTVQSYHLSATVQPYIEVNPSFVSVQVDPVGNWNHEIVDPAIAGSENLPSWPDWKLRLVDNVYANCPFTITYAGGSGNDPVLSRDEINGNGKDRLQTYLIVRNEINGVYGAYQPGHQRIDAKFVSGAEGVATGAWTNQTVNFTETPHDGEVQTEVFLSAALPHLSPDWGADNSWNQSADAGVYTAVVTATYAVLP